MDATPASANGSGFDAALKALEELDTSKPMVASETPAAEASKPVEPTAPTSTSSIIALDDEPIEPVPEMPVIAFVPVAEQDAAVEAVASVPRAEPEGDSVRFLAEAPDAAPAPSAPRPVPAVPVPVAPAGKLTKVAIGLGLFSSLLSAVGLIVAERTIMSAQLVVADAREKQQQIEHATQLIKELEKLREKQVQLLERQQAQAESAPVTSAELQHRMDALQEGLLARDPLNRVVEAVNAGKVESNARFQEFGMKMSRLEAFMERGR